MRLSARKPSWPKHPNNCPCVLIPVRDQTLLLPNVAIAEIVDYDLETDNSERRWFLGRIQWRGVSLPVLSWGGRQWR